ncbi:MAG: bifunctional nuclease family protein [Chloroflexota bacterium]
MQIRTIVESVRINVADNSRVVILKDAKIKRYLLIWIGEDVSLAIAAELQGQKHPRPMTHDLLQTVIGSLGGRVTAIHITSLQEQVFYALIVLEQGDKTLEIDARPSDAIALAVRSHVPIFVEEDVFQAAGFSVTSAPEDDEDKLAVFREFVNELDI